MKVTARLLLIAFLAGTLPLMTPVEPVFAQSDEEEEKERERKRKRPDDFNREIRYRDVITRNVTALGPFSIALFVDGQNIEGKVRVAVVAIDETKKDNMSKQTMNGILYPLLLRLYEAGRPSTQDIITFKREAKTRLSQRYPDAIEDIFIEQIY